MDQRVPSGLDFWAVKVHLSRLEVVYLNRFLQEVLVYISLALAMRPARLLGPGASAGTGSGPKAGILRENQGAAGIGGAGVAASAAATTTMGTVLQLDVTMDAPIIVMPRDSESADKVCSHNGVCAQLSILQCTGASNGISGFPTQTCVVAFWILFW